MSAHLLPWNGSYATLPGGGNRAQRQLTPQNLQTGLQTLGRTQELLRSAAGQTTIGSYLVDIIGATAEAARFGYIFDTVRQNIRNRTSTPIGAFGAELETSWGRLSAWVYARLNNPAGAGLTIGAPGYSRYYPTVAALIANLGYIELNAYKRNG